MIKKTWFGIGIFFIILGIVIGCNMLYFVLEKQTLLDELKSKGKETNLVIKEAYEKCEKKYIYPLIEFIYHLHYV